MNIFHITENLDAYKESLTKRFQDPTILDEIVGLHERYVKELYKLEQLKRIKNKLSHAIKTPQAIGALTFVPDDLFLTDVAAIQAQAQDGSLTKETLIKTCRIINSQITEHEVIVTGLLQQRNKEVTQLPNLLNSTVPVSRTEADNLVIVPCKATSQAHGSEPERWRVIDIDAEDAAAAMPLLGQYELSMRLGIVEDATAIAGNRGYFLVGAGVRLNQALISYAIDFISSKGFRLMSTPHFMTSEAMSAVCQLAEYNETLYSVSAGTSTESNAGNKFLIATSEQPLTASFRGKTVKSLPTRLAGVSTCYRREAGNHGKDTNGIFRVHQFEKVEQFVITSAKGGASQTAMKEMIETAQEFYDSLGLAYRVVNIVSGELNNAAAIKYDLEGWFPGSGAFRELVSCSNTTDYFSRRLDVRDSNGDYVHMLNSTLCANTRTICCILETYQTADGVKVPSVLQRYFGADLIPF